MEDINSILMCVSGAAFMLLVIGAIAVLFLPLSKDYDIPFWFCLCGFVFYIFLAYLSFQATFWFSSNASEFRNDLMVNGCDERKGREIYTQRNLYDVGEFVDAGWEIVHYTDFTDGAILKFNCER